MNSTTFIREYDIESINVTLTFHQKLEGEVSCVVWDAAIVLAKYLEVMYQRNKEFLKEKFVLELGSGLGCAGLVAACLGAEVVLSDLPEAIPLLQYNVDENQTLLTTKTSVCVRALSWGDKIDFKKVPDKIILADCIYYKESIDPLIKTLLDYSNSFTEIILAQELRDSEKQKNNWEYFLNEMNKNFVQVSVPKIDQHQDFCCDEIKVLKFYKK
nr:protein-lysine methyltransferase METTL21D-like isoform X1 [Onthophagus taurus]